LLWRGGDSPVCGRAAECAGEEEGAVAEIFAEFTRDELTLYSRENIMNCCRLLIRRSREEVDAC
jgi:hypothetical protein